jgi:hypothetical protein
MLLPRRSHRRSQASTKLQLLELETRLVPALAGATGTIAAAPAVSPPAVTQTAAAKAPVGANIDAVTDWALSNMFVDVMKQARQFTSVARYTPGNYVPATTDANGWATEDFETIVLSGALGAAKVDNGTYHLSFTGKADLSTPASPATITNVAYNAATNTTTADVTVNADNNSSLWYLILKFQNTNGAIKNVKLIRPGYAPNTTQTFTNEFLKQIAPFASLRLMDFAQTNNSTIVNWADRAHATDATQATSKGAAWEYAIQLANQTHKDIWVNIPEGATDDYVRQFATLLKNNLDPSLHVYVEYSNEVWNGIFAQTRANNAAAVAEVQAGMTSGHPSNLQLSGETGKNADGTWQSAWLWGDRRIARRIKEISDDFRSVWGDAAIGTTVRPVLASQSANPDLLKAQLDFLERTYGPPRQYLYAVAGAPYFSLQGDAANPNMTTDQVLAGLSAGIDQIEWELAPYARMATYYGLKDLAYEGGPDTSGGNNVAAKKAAALDPRMATLVQRYLTDWYANGGGLFNWFIAGPTTYDTSYGTWGLTNDLTQLNSPKQQGIAAVENAPPALTIGDSISAPIAATRSPDAGSNSGVTYVRPQWNGATLDYLVRADQSGTYNLTANYAAAAAGAKLGVVVNDTPVQTVALGVTGSARDGQGAPTSFGDAPPIGLHLNAGLNVVRLQTVAQGFSLNTLRFNLAQADAAPAQDAPTEVTVVTPPDDTTGTTTPATPTPPPVATPVVTSPAPSPSGTSTTPTVSTGFSYAAGITPTGLTVSGAAGVRPGRLRLTSGMRQSATAFFGTPVAAGAFRTQFDFQLSGPGDGAFAFTLQGRQGQRVGVQFDGNNATGLVVNGRVVSASSLTGQGVDLRSRHGFRAAIAYDGAMLTVTLTDLVTGKAETQKYAVNVAAVLGDTTASAGFTAGCGATALTQDVLNWTFSTSAKKA